MFFRLLISHFPISCQTQNGHFTFTMHAGHWFIAINKVRRLSEQSKYGNYREFPPSLSVRYHPLQGKKMVSHSTNDDHHRHQQSRIAHVCTVKHPSMISFIGFCFRVDGECTRTDQPRFALGFGIFGVIFFLLVALSLSILLSASSMNAHASESCVTFETKNERVFPIFHVWWTDESVLFADCISLASHVWNTLLKRRTVHCGMDERLDACMCNLSRAHIRND